MPKSRPLLVGPLVILSLLFNGCATKELWDKDTFGKAHYPASPPDLHLSYSTERKDILVEYLDHRQDSASTTRRIYWLYRNLEHQPHPDFVSSRPKTGLIIVPVYPHEKPARDPNRPDLYAVLLEDGAQFQLFSEERDLGTFDLPTWRDPSGRTIQVLLTPLALVVDAVAIGVVIGLVTAPYWAPVLIQDANH